MAAVQGIKQEESSIVPQLSARELSYSDHQNWKWISIRKNIRGDCTEANELFNGCKLQVGGKFEVGKLKEGFKYQVKFLVELTGFAVIGPVELLLTLPDGTTQKHTEVLDIKPRRKWLGLRVGEFTPEHCGCGSIKFTMLSDTKTCKKGLICIGALIEANI